VSAESVKIGPSSLDKRYLRLLMFLTHLLVRAPTVMQRSNGMTTIPQHFRGPMPFRDLDGNLYWKDTILCGAGDWPIIKRLTVKHSRQWNTLRAGVWIIAQGPPFGPAIDLVLRDRRSNGMKTVRES
jgi:hypothetical protein